MNQGLGIIRKENLPPLECLTKPYTVLPTPWRKRHDTFLPKVCCHQIALCSPFAQPHGNTCLQHRLTVFLPCGDKGPCTENGPALGVMHRSRPEVLRNCYTRATSCSFCSRPANYVLGLVHSTLSFWEAGAV